MQDRGNYQYYENNSLKDLNQPSQGQKTGKKSNYKYYKGVPNKNNLNNIDEKINMNSNNDHPQNYTHYRNRGNRKNFQDANSNQNPNFKKKNKKKRDNNNDYQYQGNNAIEINAPTKDDYIEQQNNINLGGGNNNHQNIYGKQYKKNQSQNIYNNNLINNNISPNLNSTIGSMNTNTNSSNNSNISNINLTPQGKNQITTPLGYNLNNSNSPLHAMISQQNTQNQTMYINPKIALMGNMRQAQSLTGNDQDMSTKDEKSSENLSEETLSIGRNLNMQANNQNDGNGLDINKTQNDFINKEMYMNNKYLQQQNNYFPMAYSMNNNISNNMNNMNNNFENLNNINGINNINNNYNNINNLQNIPNYNQNIPNQLNNSMANMNNINNLPLNNFQRQMYDNQNNKLFNSTQIQHNYTFPNNEDININMNHKKLKKMQNKSPMDPTNIANSPMNVGNIYNLNYNGPNNKFIKNQNNNMGMNMNNKMSLSSQGTKNTIPNFNPGENLNLMASQSQQIPSLLNMNFNPLNNRNFYVPQNMRNSHMNNNFINNNHINNPNNNINNKDFNNSGFNHNNMGNNKKYQKQYNYNNNAYQQPNHLNNNNTNMNNNNQIFNNKNNKSNLNNDNNNFNLNNNNLLKNYNQRASKESNSHSNSNKNNINISNNNNQQQKQYLLCLNIRLRNKQIMTIKIKSLEECPIILKEMKENKKIDEKDIKIIQNKIYETIEITKKIYNFGLNKYTYKNLAEINNKIMHNKGRKNKNKIKNSNSSKQVNTILGNEMMLSKEDIRKTESLNISF